MKISFFVPLGVALVFAAAGCAQTNKPGAARPPVYYGNDFGDPVLTQQHLNPPPPAAPPVAQPPPVGGPYVYEQWPLQQMPAMISQTEAAAIVERFRTNYARLGSPRFLIYVNRELVDQQTGVKLSGRTETVETSTQRSSNNNGTNGASASESASTRNVVKNNYHIQPRSTYSLADRQTVRDVERLMGRPLRQAGATLVDQTVATELIGDQPLQDLAAGVTGQQAAKDREALGKIADVAIEVLISSRGVTVAEISGDRTYSVPDIQVTAIRLKDARVTGQASAAEVMSHAPSPGYAARNFGVQAVSEATALSLMDDMVKSAP